jgi:hypothetical protein
VADYVGRKEMVLTIFGFIYLQMEVILGDNKKYLTGAIDCCMMDFVWKKCV